MSSSPSRPAFDLTMFAENWDSGNDPLYPRILGIFRAEAARFCVDIGLALAREDRAGLAHSAHLVKGSSGNVCAMSLYESAANLEDAAPGASLGELHELFTLLRGDWQNLEQSIEAGEPLNGL